MIDGSMIGKDMIGRDPGLIVTAADDEFHPPTSDDPSWIETLWFPCFVPEQEMSVAVRVWFSPNAGKQGATISGWRGDKQGLFGDRWVEDYENKPQLKQLKLSRGLSIECLQALQRYRLSHRSDAVELDLEFDAIMAPNPVAPEESPGMFLGHIEQAGHVTGEVRYRDKTVAIDSYSIRDRSWGPREMPEQLRLGNAYGTAKDFAFFTYINPDAAGVERITSGYLLQDGVAAKIVSGKRHTEWRDDVPVAVRIDAIDASGRELQVQGNCLNVMASNAGNGVYGVLNLVEWRTGDKHCWGENHDIWSETMWLAAGRPAL